MRGGARGLAVGIASVVASVVSIALVTASFGCVPIDGGAIELAWTVRTEDAHPADCREQGIAAVALCLRDCDDSGACTGPQRCPFMTFPCERGQGATSFSVTPGRKELWVTASCIDGSSARIRVPEPLLRDVTTGDVTQLNALLIAVPSTGFACASQESG